MYRYLLGLVFLTVAFCTPVRAQTEMAQSKWDIYLDHAYELTYWDSNELKAWLTERETEFGQTLAQFTEEWHGKIDGPAENAGSDSLQNDRLPYPEQAYRRLAVAELLLYLKTGDAARLDKAVHGIERLKSKFEKPEIAYWYYNIHAFEALSGGSVDPRKASEEFAKNIFRIWLDIILPREEAHTLLNVPDIPVSMRDFSFSLPYLYENIADLILSKAIIRSQIKDTGSLGAIITGLADRLSIQNGYADKVKAVVNRMSGPASDNHNLSFTVIFLEAEANRFMAQNGLNKEGPSPSAEDAFRKSYLYYNLAYDWANTKQGKASVLSDYLDLVSFAYSRLPERDKLTGSIFFATLSGHEGFLTIERAIHLYEDLATPEMRERAWTAQGFSERKDYITTMHNLWNSIAEQSLWSAYYHEKGMTLRDIENYSEKVISCQTELLSYLKFFERNIQSGYMDIVPDNAYFNAADAAAKYSALQHRLAPYSIGMSSYYRSFARLLQYIELFPYDPEAIMELAQQLNEMGKPELFVEYVLPLADQFRKSDVMKKWKLHNAGGPAVASLEVLQEVIPEIIMKANTLIYLQRQGAEIAQDVISQRLLEIQKQSAAFLKNKEPDLPSKSFGAMTKGLNELIRRLSSAHDTGESAGRKKVIDDATKVLGEIQELEEANRILVKLPEYIKLSKTIKLDLAQKVDNPVHSLLRRNFHELTAGNKNYIQILSMISGSGDR